MVLEESRSQDLISIVARQLALSNDILFITGAGISADSGLPTYRGVGGLYNDSLAEEGMPIEMVLAGETLRRQPELTWKYLIQIESRCRAASYNRAHSIIAEMEKSFRRVWVLTQNIDGFHQAAGSKNVIDIHGDMHRLYCSACGWRTTVKDYGGLDIPPLCPGCGGILRPEVVFFGEALPFDKISVLHEEMARGFDIYFSIGTSSVFPYIQQPILEAKSHQKFCVEINPATTEISSFVEVRIAASATEALEAIWRECKKYRQLQRKE